VLKNDITFFPIESMCYGNGKEDNYQKQMYFTTLEQRMTQQEKMFSDI